MSSSPTHIWWGSKLLQAGQTGIDAMQERSKRTRARIVHAAAEMFAGAGGYQAVTLVEIARRAGVTTGALYFHFDSKLQIAQFIVEEQHRLSTLRGQAVLGKGLSGLDTFSHLSASLGYSILMDPVVRAGMALSTETLLFPEGNRQHWFDWMLYVTDLLNRGVEEGDVRPDTDTSKLGKLIGPAWSGVRLGSQILHENADLLERLRDLSVVILPAFTVETRTDALIRDAHEIFEEYIRRRDEALSAA